MEARCLTCKFWEAPDKRKYATQNPLHGDNSFGRCSKIPSALGFTEERRSKCDDGKVLLSEQLAVMNYEVVDLATKPEFGCVLWEAGESIT